MAFQARKGSGAFEKWAPGFMYNEFETKKNWYQTSSEKFKIYGNFEPQINWNSFCVVYGLDVLYM